VNALMIVIVLMLRARGLALRDRLAAEHGEGVISAAIAVLIIALLGAAMWAVFSGMMTGATTRINDSVESIG